SEPCCSPRPAAGARSRARTPTSAAPCSACCWKSTKSPRQPCGRSAWRRCCGRPRVDEVDAEAAQVSDVARLTKIDFSQRSRANLAEYPRQIGAGTADRREPGSEAKAGSACVLVLVGDAFECFPQVGFETFASPLRTLLQPCLRSRANIADQDIGHGYFD